MFKKLRAAFHLFIETVQANTTAVQALAAEQRDIRTRLDILVEHSAFQTHVTKQALSRSGHKV